VIRSNNRTERRISVTRCLAVILFIVLACISHGQALGQSRNANNGDFHVVFATDAHVLTSSECSGLKLVAVYVAVPARNQARLEEIGKTIASNYPIGINLVIYFVTERKNLHAMPDSYFEEEFFKSLRGLYVRGHMGERVYFLPFGLNEKMLEALSEIRKEQL
jgi:hypothetical protein